MKIAQEE
ncbi:unnamed protein product, partial [Strongylus vulgaris]